MKSPTAFRGFTLLELLIVVIIVGVLASVAMPNLMRNVENSRAVEAKNTMGVIRRLVEGCVNRTGNYADCVSWDAVGMTDPSNANFRYNILFPGVAPCLYTISADHQTGPGVLNLVMLTTGVVWCGTNGYEGFNTGACTAGPENTCLSW